MRQILAITLFFCYGISDAQESNYANYEVGANSTMMGGAVTAGVKDNSAVYYNPGALAFITESNVTLETGNFYGGQLIIKNGAGNGLDIESTFFDVIPGAISGTVKSQKLPDWTFTYSILTTNSSLIKFSVRNSMAIDILPSNPGDELYEGQFSYSNEMRENGFAFGTAKKIGNNLGIGVSVFGVYNSQVYFLNQEATANAIIDDRIANTLAFSRLTRDLTFGSATLVFQMGAVYKLEKTKWALNITAPKLNLNVLADATVTENVNLFIPFDNASEAFTINRFGEDLKTIQRSPLRIALGHEIIMKKSIWNFKVTYHTKISKYNRVVAPVNPEVDGVDVGFVDLEVLDEGTEIVNVAAGAIYKIREGLSFMGGARTDFNFARNLPDPEEQDFYARMSYWNLFHLTGGVIWQTDKLNLTLGADYATGFDKGRLQQVNLTEPTIENLLFGELTTNTSTYLNQIYVVVGLSYKFE
ncbi:MAG: hypothetical protein L3J29_07900 [Cyclobacteriaceae bacterium]|nr:hypothetical protein [Cyclobacteriaceae bacterium]